MMGESKPVLLVVAPMPLFPTIAGNRRYLLSVCDFLKDAGFQLDFAYVAHEDQVYRNFGHHPPTDMEAMAAYFRRVFFVEIEAPIKLSTSSLRFELDDWCPAEAIRFVSWYFAQSRETCGIAINYVFLSHCLEAAPEDTLRLLITHDRFSNRRKQYIPFRSAPNFYHTDERSEARGLGRADMILAIQQNERAYFQRISSKQTFLLAPDIPPCRDFKPTLRLKTIGFMGHGNDANVMSLQRFLRAWTEVWRPRLPKLLIAGEVCQSLPKIVPPGVEAMGHVKRLETFFNAIDLVIAPIILGTGFKLKVIEALAHGKAVVGTQQAFEGMDADFLAHRFVRAEEIASYIADHWNDAVELGALTTECAKLLVAYRATARSESEKLRAAILGHVATRRSPAFMVAPKETVRRAVETSYGAFSFVEDVTLCSSQDSSNEYGALVATEFVPVDDNSGSDRGYSPLRRRWHVRASSDREALFPLKQSACPPHSPLAGRRVSLAPLLTRIASSMEDEERASVAARVLDDAVPDWATTGRLLRSHSGELSLLCAAPSSLYKSPGAANLFLIPHAAMSGLRITSVSYLPLHGRAPGVSNASQRCADLFLTPTHIRGELKDVFVETVVRSFLLVAYGRFGRIVINGGDTACAR